jgi:valyl-tRNA synthetase
MPVEESKSAYSAPLIEKKWQEFWESSKTYAWRPEVPRENTFVVDTPPPTVSGSLHLGHVFSYTHTDIIVRYQRMRGKNIFYPMGWDDNGLPTERRVQNYFNIRCDPHLSYDPHFRPEPGKDGTPLAISRQNFIESCAALTEIDEKIFEELWRRLGLSVDWSQTYATIDKHSQRISQLSFIDLYEKGEAYNSFSPNMWDIDFQSAVSQAESEDREKEGFLYEIEFNVKDSSKKFCIATTRPELLPGCIAIVAHPDDIRYQALFGSEALTPLFHVPVPIMASEHADMTKGSGILMVCTFGDTADVEFWRKKELPLRQIIGLDGRLQRVNFGTDLFPSENPLVANENYALLQGLFVNQARKRILESLKESKQLIGEPKKVIQHVKFYEKGDRPLELIPTRQWFIRLLEHKEALLNAGRKINWYPSYMLSRYEHWVNGLNQDWCISRQRYFGVPFPVWYRLDEFGQPLFKEPIIAGKASLPIDPESAPPPGFTEDLRGKPGGFIGDPDVMDTWATSSITPQLSSHWELDNERHSKLFPADLRPQGHDIIRTWAFYTILKSWLHTEEIPWKNITLSGWILDPDRKKMSKSKGNVVTPEDLLEKYSSDVIRYWAGRGRLGADTAIDENVFKIGHKLVTKLINASRFILQRKEVFDDVNFTLIDEAILFKLDSKVMAITVAFDEFDYTTALALTEEFFWIFCDYFIELLKGRFYQGDQSAIFTLNLSLETLLRLFAPYLPYVCEELWHERHSSSIHTTSIHQGPWPTTRNDIKEEGDKLNLISVTLLVLDEIRGAKTKAKLSPKTALSGVKVWCNDTDFKRLGCVWSDIALSLHVPKEGLHQMGINEDDNKKIRCEIIQNSDSSTQI